MKRFEKSGYGWVEMKKEYWYDIEWSDTRP
jgi:hypothetical protein